MRGCRHASKVNWERRLCSVMWPNQCSSQTGNTENYNINTQSIYSAEPNDESPANVDAAVSCTLWWCGLGAVYTGACVLLCRNSGEVTERNLMK